MNLKELVYDRVQFLHTKEQTNFSDIPLQEVPQFSKLLKEYKASEGKDECYFTFKTEVKKLRASKLHTRIFDAFRKQHICPIQVRNKIPSELTNDNSHLQELEQWLETNINPTSQAVRLAQEIKWAHGTNSSALALLKDLDYTFLPTGELLRQGIAPMNGELQCAGMGTSGVSQKSISSVPIEDIARSWDKYANKNEFHLSFEQNQDVETTFLKDLESLQNLSPDDDKWDLTIISLLRSKQWDPEAFQDLCTKYKSKIEELKQNVVQKCSYKENSVLKALDWDLNELREACTNDQKRISIENELGIESRPRNSCEYVPDWYEDTTGSMRIATSPYFMRNIQEHWKTIIRLILKARLFSKFDEPNEFEEEVNRRCCREAEQELRDTMNTRIQKNMIPFQDRYQRLLNVFEKPSPVKLSEADREMISNPFPILIASTKTKATPHSTNTELLLKRARLGEDIDVIFVKPENVEEMQAWLREHSLDEKVKVYSSELLQEIVNLPLLHSSDQVIDNHPYLSAADQKRVGKTLQEKVLPLYKAPYPGGSHRILHGVMHSLRSSLLSQVLAEFNRRESQPLNTKLETLIYGTALHDVQRKNDGVDLWDSQSGQKCEEMLLELDVEPSIASAFNRAIADKESLSPESLEHKILHDADCLEILRFYANLDKFDFERLWIYQELNKNDVIDLIKEVHKFISLTEKEEIKKTIENNEDPYRAIVQVLSFAHNSSGNFSQMTEYLGSAIEAFAKSPSDSQSLPPEIQQAIKAPLDPNAN